MHEALNPPILYCLSGLPGVGKTTLAMALVERLRAAYLRIDTIEQAMRDLCRFDVQGEGYALAYRLAADNLRLGISLVADSCNPIELTRSHWHAVAEANGARCIDIEVVCCDRAEHRRRVETRDVSVPNLRSPTWAEVEGREYHPWTTPRIVIDTAWRTVEACVEELIGRIA